VTGYLRQGAALVLGLAGSCLTGVGSAEAVEAPKPARPTVDIEFHAGEVTVEGPLNRLTLSRGVELTVDRYRLTADRLELVRGARGVELVGEGEVSLCACAGSPFSVSYDRALVAPPTDLLLHDSTLRFCGLPFFYTPVFWVRSPSRLGLFVPRLAWRGTDGGYVGSGVHVPLSKSVDPSPEFLDVNLGGYLAGGWDLETQLVTTNTVTSVRHDWLRRGLLSVDALGHRRLAEGAALTFRIDALRGLRGLTGPVSFDAATRRQDRLRIELSHGVDALHYAVGYAADPPRAGRVRDLDERGAVMRAGIGTALGEFGHVETTSFLRTNTRHDGEEQLRFTQLGHVGIDARPSVFAMSLDGYQRFATGARLGERQNSAMLGSEFRLALPLVRRYVLSERLLDHWVEPFLGVRGAMGRGWLVDGAARVVQGGAAELGIGSTVGHLGGTGAGRLELKGGVLRHQARTLQALSLAPLLSFDVLGAGGELAILSSGAALSTARLRLGQTNGVSLRLQLEGRSGAHAGSIRWMNREGWDSHEATYLFDESGWTAGSSLLVPIGRTLAVHGRTDVELRQPRLLAERMAVTYRHGCGCAAATLDGGHRLGRAGWDVSLYLDIMPR